MLLSMHLLKGFSRDSIQSPFSMESHEMHRSSEPISVLRTWNKESWLHFGLLYFICYIDVFRSRSEFILLPKHPDRLLESGTFFL